MVKLFVKIIVLSYFLHKIVKNLEAALSLALFGAKKNRLKQKTKIWCFILRAP